MTGGGGGIGRAHALLLSALGAQVVVNDVGAAADVVAEIEAAGGKAVANGDDVSSWDGAKRLVDTAVESFGRLDVLVNNAGILRDRMLTTLSEQEFDDVVRVNLKGHVAPMRWAAAYWREEAKAGRPLAARVVNTSSGSGLWGNAGQANYAAAKSGVAAVTLVAARELERYGVKVNAIAPAARTRLTEGVPVVSEAMAAPDDPAAFDVFDPANVSPFVAFLGSEACQFSGHVFGVIGGKVARYDGFTEAEAVDVGRRWELDEIAAAVASWTTAIPEIPEP
ncbi:MAG: short-chain dehydrogenase [Actinomycetia bacterium]|nr:short-chain dehydrogenase [Actinomycetes bacterium]